MPKATQVTVTLNLNNASSLLTYLRVLTDVTKRKDPELFRIFEQKLYAADWTGAVKCREPLERAISQA